MPITHPHHTALFVTDLTRSLDFYVGLLGFELLNRNDGWGGDFLDRVVNAEGARINLAVLQLGGVTIELIQVLSPADFPTDASTRASGLARVGFAVEDIDEVYTRLEAAGVRFMGEGVIQTVWWEPEVDAGTGAAREADGSAPVASHFKGGRAVNFFDPDGIVLELQEPVERGRVT